jgi:hypothetical protein
MLTTMFDASAGARRRLALCAGRRDHRLERALRVARAPVDALRETLCV